MRKLHRHKENAAAVLLAMCVSRALSGNGFTCHNTTSTCRIRYITVKLLFLPRTYYCNITLPSTPRFPTDIPQATERAGLTDNAAVLGPNSDNPL
jgi:hypothetical protein